MIHKQLKSQLAFVLVLEIAASCTPFLMGPSDQSSSLVIGRVVIDNKYAGAFYGVLPQGTVDKGLDVEVESRDGKQTFKATTEEEGYFFLPNMPPNTYHILRVSLEGHGSNGLRERQGLTLRRPIFTPVPGKLTYIGTLTIDLADRGESKIRELREDDRAKAYFQQKYAASPWSSREFASAATGAVAGNQAAKGKIAAHDTTSVTPPTGTAEKPVWKVGFEWRYAWKRPGASGTLTREIVREDTFEGTPIYAMKVGKEEYSYTKDVLGLLAHSQGAKLTDKRTPAYQIFSWPLYVGKEWRDTYLSENPAEKSSRTFDFRNVVSGFEKVQVAAGVFDAYKIDTYNFYSGNLVEEHWYSPGAKWYVKARYYRQDGLLEHELMSFKAD